MLWYVRYLGLSLSCMNTLIREEGGGDIFILWAERIGIWWLSTLTVLRKYTTMQVKSVLFLRGAWLCSILEQVLDAVTH